MVKFCTAFANQWHHSLNLCTLPIYLIIKPLPARVCCKHRIVYREGLWFPAVVVTYLHLSKMLLHLVKDFYASKLIVARFIVNYVNMARCYENHYVNLWNLLKNCSVYFIPAVGSHKTRLCKKSTTQVGILCGSPAAPNPRSGKAVYKKFSPAGICAAPINLITSYRCHMDLSKDLWLVLITASRSLKSA